jgi:PAS domain S-box-containing protein
MLHSSAPLLTIALLNILIGSYVLRQQTMGITHRAFGFFAFSIALWTVSIALAHHASIESTLWTRMSFASAAIMVFFLFILFRTFPNEPQFVWTWQLITFAGLAIILMILSFTSLIVQKATLGVDGLKAEYGPLHRLFALYTYSAFGGSCLMVTRKYRASSGLVRLQFHYLLLGLLVPVLGVTFTNLLIPLVFGTSRLGQYGPYFGLIFLGFTAHALIRYRFMNIRLVLQRSITFLLALSGAVSVLVLALGAVWTYMSLPLESAQILVLLVGGLIVGLLLQPLRSFFGRVLDRYVYRTDINYQTALRDASRALVGILDLDDLVDYTLRTALQAVRAERAALYLASSEGLMLQAERTEHSDPTVFSPSSLPPSSPLLEHFKRLSEPLVAEEIPKRLDDSRARPLLDVLKAHKWGLVIPITPEHRLQGLLALGPKLSGDPFYPDELEFLSILTNQVGIAVRNAQLYKEVLLANHYVENILRTMDSGVITVDERGRVAVCNSTAARLTGLSRERLTSLNVETLPGPIGSQLHQTLIDGHARSQVETVLPGEGDRRTPLVCSTSALQDGRGTIIGALIVFSDLSKIKALESEKSTAERLASLGSLVSGIAHEIKNPLVAIKTFAELLPERFSDTDFRDDFSKVVRTEIDRIDGLVGRLRGLAAPKPETEAATDIREPIAETLVLLRGQLEQMQTTVHRNFGSSEALVSIDPAQAKQLFLNLFLNAIEAMNPGGQLAIRVARLQRQGQPWVQVAVSDTGPGIPDAIRAKIFDPFFTTKATGSGLGLAICRSITDAHRGTIRAESVTPGAGTTILVEFPGASIQARVAERSAVLR